ncbi:MAG TPA: CTP synthase [Candidatus Krumholzibacteria bacterium]|nr:CTP synthase [Candidatus Krumholzibacteria bacterium]
MSAADGIEAPRKAGSNTRYVFVTGGVVSSLGKGIATASLGKLLKARGLSVILQKFDPYLNVDPGTMNPFQHGEVFVTEDGAETDLDLGHYERFLDQNLSQLHNVTTGQIYDTILSRERKGEYLGRTVQVIPHVTDEIKHRIKLPAIKAPEDAPVDVVITEIGGTVGDIESLPFVEAIRQMRLDLGSGRSLFIHLTLVPWIETAGELKTKPTQHSVREMRGIGIQPDVLVARCKTGLPSDVRRKIALFCNVDEECVIDALDVESIYEVPLRLQAQHLDEIVCRKLDLPLPDIDLEGWRRIVDGIYNATEEVRIALVGKYTGLKDAYKSIIESFVHAGVTNGVRVEIDWVSAEAVADDGPAVHLSRADGVLIPGGFGERGIEGKIAAVRHARENGVPFLGICLGLQVAVIEYARGVMGLNKANSTELGSETPDPVIALMSEQEGIEDLGGTMRLGTYPCELREGTVARRLYGKDLVQERHRHRYEVNNNYRDRLEAAGMIFSGVSPDGVLAEIVEIPEHPFFVGVQFHPELRSRPERVHPLFHGLVEAAAKHHRTRTTMAAESGAGPRPETEEA